jgi:hypothetical protein
MWSINSIVWSERTQWVRGRGGVAGIGVRVSLLPNSSPGKQAKWRIQPTAGPRLSSETIGLRLNLPLEHGSIPRLNHIDSICRPPPHHLVRRNRELNPSHQPPYLDILPHSEVAKSPLMSEIHSLSRRPSLTGMCLFFLLEKGFGSTAKYRLGRSYEHAWLRRIACLGPTMDDWDLCSSSKKPTHSETSSHPPKIGDTQPS